MRPGATLLAVLLLAGCATPAATQRHEYVEMSMASPARLVLYAESEPAARRAARAVFDRFHELERIMSDWMKDSEVRRLAARAPERVEISPTLERALRLALEHADRTGGAFDPTIGPLVELWRTTRRTGTLPDREDLELARSRVGRDAIELGAGTARITRPGVGIDLGGIGKGLALDEGRAVLEAHGIDRHLIDFDGEVAAGTPPPGRSAWFVTVSVPGASEATLELALVDAAVSTSGDVNQHVVVDGRRYSHVLDPRTGLGLQSSIQVTVISPQGTTSDALATAGCVLGPDALRALIEARHPEASAIVVTGAAGAESITVIGRPPLRGDAAP